MASEKKSRDDATSVATTVFYTGKEKLREGCVMWIIEGMKAKMEKFKPGEKISTDTFRIKESKWSLSIYPNGWSEQMEGNISVSLVSQNSSNVTAEAEFRVGHGDEGFFKTGFDRPFEFTRNGKGSGFSKYLSHECLLKNEGQLMSHGKIELSVTVTLSGEGKTCSEVNLQLDSALGNSKMERLCELSDNFESLLWDEKSSDFQIICDDEIFHCHRIVLDARSHYFRGVFKNAFLENTSSQINMEGIASEIVKAIIEYMYTGKLKDLQSKAIQLLKAANMFDFSLMKKSCEESLISVLKIDNAVDMFVLADEHNSPSLKQEAKKIILENKADIVKQAGWEEKIGTLVFELFKAPF